MPYTGSLTERHSAWTTHGYPKGGEYPLCLLGTQQSVFLALRMAEHRISGSAQDDSMGRYAFIWQQSSASPMGVAGRHPWQPFLDQLQFDSVN